MKDPMDPQQVLELAQRAMGPDGANRRRLDTALLAAGVSVPAALSTGVAHAALHGAAAHGAVGQGAVASTVGSGTAGAGLSGGTSTATALTAKTSMFTGLSAKASAGLGLLGSVGAGKLTVAAVIVGSGVVGVYAEHRAEQPLQEAATRGPQTPTQFQSAGVAERPTSVSFGGSAVPPTVVVPPAPALEVTGAKQPKREGPAKRRVEPVIAPAAPAQSRAIQATRATTRPEAHSAPPAEGQSVAELKIELQALRSIDAALASGDGSSALRLLRELNARVPQGSMLPERRVNEVLALCQTGQTERAQLLARRLIAGNGGFYTRRLMNTCALHTTTEFAPSATREATHEKSVEAPPKPEALETK